MTDAIDLHIGRRLQRRRSKFYPNQGAFACTMGMSLAQIRGYERGTNPVPPAVLWRFARLLEVPISYFYGDFEQPDATYEEEHALLSAYGRLAVPLRKRIFDLVTEAAESSV